LLMGARRYLNVLGLSRPISGGAMQALKHLGLKFRYGVAGISAGVVAVTWFINLYCISCGIDWNQIPLWPVLIIPSYIGGSLAGRQFQNWALAILGGTIGALVGSYILIKFVLGNFQ
jgi:hypothetical protein